jgi:Protein of unknown function (DUF998)
MAGVGAPAGTERPDAHRSPRQRLRPRGRQSRQQQVEACKRSATVLWTFTGASRRHCQRAGQHVPGAGTLATMPPGRHAPSVTTVRNVPWWGLFSSGAAPVLMVGGWTVATGLQPQPVDPVAETVSSLAAVGAAERWVMTATFLAVGLCYIVTGLALRPAAAAGRLILVAGAGIGMLVAAFPSLPTVAARRCTRSGRRPDSARLRSGRPRRGGAALGCRGRCGRRYVPSPQCLFSSWRGLPRRWSPRPGRRGWPNGSSAGPRRYRR